MGEQESHQERDGSDVHGQWGQEREGMEIQDPRILQDWQRESLWILDYC